jgi:hypothetical protein
MHKHWLALQGVKLESFVVYVQGVRNTTVKAMCTWCRLACTSPFTGIWVQTSHASHNSLQSQTSPIFYASFSRLALQRLHDATCMNHLSLLLCELTCASQLESCTCCLNAELNEAKQRWWWWWLMTLNHSTWKETQQWQLLSIVFRPPSFLPLFPQTSLALAWTRCGDIPLIQWHFSSAGRLPLQYIPNASLNVCDL